MAMPSVASLVLWACSSFSPQPSSKGDCASWQALADYLKQNHAAPNVGDDLARQQLDKDAAAASCRLKW